MVLRRGALVLAALSLLAAFSLAQHSKPVADNGQFVGNKFQERDMNGPFPLSSLAKPVFCPGT
jgi:hypothetical protein